MRKSHVHAILLLLMLVVGIFLVAPGVSQASVVKKYRKDYTYRLSKIKLCWTEDTSRYDGLKRNLATNENNERAMLDPRTAPEPPGAGEVLPRRLQRVPLQASPSRVVGGVRQQGHQVQETRERLLHEVGATAEVQERVRRIDDRRREAERECVQRHPAGLPAPERRPARLHLGRSEGHRCGRMVVCRQRRGGAEAQDASGHALRSTRVRGAATARGSAGQFRGCRGAPRPRRPA